MRASLWGPWECPSHSFDGCCKCKWTIAICYSEVHHCWPVTECGKATEMKDSSEGQPGLEGSAANVSQHCAVSQGFLPSLLHQDQTCCVVWQLSLPPPAPFLCPLTGMSLHILLHVHHFSCCSSTRTSIVPGRDHRSTKAMRRLAFSRNIKEVHGSLEVKKGKSGRRWGQRCIWSPCRRKIVGLVNIESFLKRGIKNLKQWCVCQRQNLREGHYKFRI